MSREGMARLCRRCGRQLRVNHARDSWHCRECLSHARRPSLATEGFNPACRDPQHDPEWWWPETANDSCIPVAIAICFQCPVVDKCLAYALTAKEREGIWGGTTPAERRHLMSQDKAS